MDTHATTRGAATRVVARETTNAGDDDGGEFEDPVEAATLSLLIIIIIALAGAFGYVYFVELPRYKASASLELTPGPRGGVL